MSKSNNTKLLPPKSLMNLEDSEKVWEIISKRYPKAAPLLCEMESVLNEAENLVDQLQLSSNSINLEIVHSSEDESSNVNLDQEIISEIIENENLKSDMQKDFEVQKTNLSEVVEERTTELIEISKNQKLTEILNDDENETVESLSLLKKVVETIKKSEKNILMQNSEENLKINLQPNEKLPETENALQMKTSETESTDNSWSQVVGDSSESNESFYDEFTNKLENAESEKKSKEILLKDL